MKFRQFDINFLFISFLYCMLYFVIDIFILFDLIIFKIDDLYYFVFWRWILWWNSIFLLNFNNIVIVLHYFLWLLLTTFIFLLIRSIFFLILSIFLSLISLYSFILFPWLVLDHFYKLILNFDGILITFNIDILIHLIDLLSWYFVEVRSTSNKMIGIEGDSRMDTVKFQLDVGSEIFVC